MYVKKLNNELNDQHNIAINDMNNNNASNNELNVQTTNMSNTVTNS